jgi:hypothetical protein
VNAECDVAESSGQYTKARNFRATTLIGRDVGEALTLNEPVKMNREVTSRSQAGCLGFNPTICPSEAVRQT